jgi:hypothetical protein
LTTDVPCLLVACTTTMTGLAAAMALRVTSVAMTVQSACTMRDSRKTAHLEVSGLKWNLKKG